MADVSADVAHSHPQEDSTAAIDKDTEGPYVLLRDEPIERADEDRLDMVSAADGIASVLRSSVRSAPFVLAIDAGWGMGKSSLLNQIGNQLGAKSGIIQLHFNAWTAEGMDTLEGLIKAVLGKLDRNALRRGARWLADQRSVLVIARIASGVLARFLGVPRLVDDLWSKVNADAKSRNELRGLIKETLGKWVSASKRDPNRALVIFIDDLDRCSDDVVVKVCEAVKLYLDAPGLIFVLACDQSVLARGVSGSARGDASAGRAYLEKIIQVAYRMRAPDERQITDLIGAYARDSGLAGLFGQTVTSILAEGTGRNPRRIKRIINSFVLEYRLDRTWREQAYGRAKLMTALLLQHLYTPFYELLISESGAGLDDDIHDYLKLREKMNAVPADDKDPWWEICDRFFRNHGAAPPSRQSAEIVTELESLNEELPADFPGLARNSSFRKLLHRIEETGGLEALRELLMRSPLSTAPARPAEPEGRVFYQGLFEWIRPVPEDLAQRQISCQHAVRYVDRVPDPAALCGYRYRADELAPEKTAILWGVGVPHSMRCQACAAALRKASYPLWDIGSENPFT